MDRLATLLLSLGSLLVACSGQLTDLEKAQVLDVHNALRGEVQPQAANMKKLVNTIMYRPCSPLTLTKFVHDSLHKLAQYWGSVYSS